LVNEISLDYDARSKEHQNKLLTVSVLGCTRLFLVTHFPVAHCCFFLPFIYQYFNTVWWEEIMSLENRSH